MQTRVIQNACKIISDLYNPNISSATLATKVHKLVYDTLGDPDPYRALKQRSNNVAQRLLPKVEQLLTNSENPLKTGMLCSIIGNILDFGIEGASTTPESLMQSFDHFVQEGLGYDDYPKLEKLIKKARHIMLFTDNCGEIVFDRLLCRELKKFNPHIVLTLVVKGEPIISDATLEDIKDLLFEEVVDNIYTTGCFAIGLDFSKLPQDVEKQLNQADLILCKGMANYEAFSEKSYHPVAYLLRTKCHAIAHSLGLPLNINAIKVFE